MPQPIPIRNQQQTQSGTKEVPRQDAVFDPDKSRAARQQGMTASGQTQESEERFHLEGESEPPASVIGGVGGRPMSRRETKLEAVPDEMGWPADGRMTGTNRSPKVLQKNRKRRAA
jgi:hypothetical protein